MATTSDVAAAAAAVPAQEEDTAADATKRGVPAATSAVGVAVSTNATTRPRGQPWNWYIVLCGLACVWMACWLLRAATASALLARLCAHDTRVTTAAAAAHVTASGVRSAQASLFVHGQRREQPATPNPSSKELADAWLKQQYQVWHSCVYKTPAGHRAVTATTQSMLAVPRAWCEASSGAAAPQLTVCIVVPTPGVTAAQSLAAAAAFLLDPSCTVLWTWTALPRRLARDLTEGLMTGDVGRAEPLDMWQRQVATVVWPPCTPSQAFWQAVPVLSAWRQVACECVQQQQLQQPQHAADVTAHVKTVLQSTQLAATGTVASCTAAAIARWLLCPPPTSEHATFASVVAPAPENFVATHALLCGYGFQRFHLGQRALAAAARTLAAPPAVAPVAPPTAANVEDDDQERAPATMTLHLHTPVTFLSHTAGATEPWSAIGMSVWHAVSGVADASVPVWTFPLAQSDLIPRLRVHIHECRCTHCAAHARGSVLPVVWPDELRSQIEFM